MLGSDRFAECLRVLLALGGIVAYSLVSGHIAQSVPLMLGAIACALAETEDHWRNRLGTLLLTLVCFALTALAVEWLLPFPWAFALALPLGTFALVMLGAASSRYNTIAGATLILAVYAMIAGDAVATRTGFLRMPLELLAGAGWYGVLSMVWSALLPQQAVRHALARLFDALADYLDAKAAMLAPVRGVDRAALALAAARRNEQVVQALDEMRILLIDRIGNRRPRGATAQRLALYFMAQDIHERAHSALHPYDELAHALFHSDVLFRCEYLLRLQASQCRAHAGQLRLRGPLSKEDRAHEALHDVRDAIAALDRLPTPPAPGIRRSLDALYRNLGGIQRLLDHEAAATVPEQHSRHPLQDPAPQSLVEGWARIRVQLTPESFRFRHAVRLAVALLAGYGTLLALHPRHGYWILMTTVFVCQPSYVATYRRLTERVAGTATGLVLGWAALQLLPPGPWQWPLVAIAGMGFFAFRLRRYATATAMITVFVMLCFNQFGYGETVMWPRLLDTLAGALIAALAIRFVLPDWRGRQLRQVLADALRSDARYLSQILAQYAHGRHDDLAYRIARRDAHSADANLGGVAFNALREPGQRRDGDLLLRFLATTHALLGHLSALGAHRQVIIATDDDARVAATGARVVDALEQLAGHLQDATPAPASMFATGSGVLPEDAQATGETARLVLGQLALIGEQCRRVAALAGEIGDRR